MSALISYATECANLWHSKLPLNSQKWLIVLIFVILNMATEAANGQACLPCEVQNELKKVKSDKANYEEYVMEHQVSRRSAIEALLRLDESFFDGPTEPGCRTINCNHHVMKYCLGPLFINDHCLCESSHEEEGLPFVPHVCYVGDRPHTASAGSCFFYMELKNCCCARALAKRWRSLSAAATLDSSKYLVIPLIIVIQKFIFLDIS